MWQIRVYNVGKPVEWFMIRADPDAPRRPAWFANGDCAMEACHIIAELRRDTAFEGTEVVFVPSMP